MLSSPSGAAKLSLAVVFGLFGLKVAVGVITGSISIWAQAADSSLDLFAVVITFFTVAFAAKPADKEHPFGHGKIEYVAAGIQTILLFSAAGIIIYSSILRIIRGEVIQLTEAGIGVMLVSMIASILLSRHLFRVARNTGSVALEANANNIRSDVYSAAGVLGGLVAVRLTGLTIFDPILALAVSLLILRAAYRVGKMAWDGLIDVRLPEAEEAIIRTCILEHSGKVVAFHELRTRKAGSLRYIDLHLVMPRNVNLEEAHRTCDHLEQDIEERLSQTNVTIHVEPCTIECAQCSVSCALRQKKG